MSISELYERIWERFEAPTGNSKDAKWVEVDPKDLSPHDIVRAYPKGERVCSDGGSIIPTRMVSRLEIEDGKLYVITFPFYICTTKKELKQ
jgi:hypothetical protein